MVRGLDDWVSVIGLSSCEGGPSKCVLDGQAHISEPIHREEERTAGARGMDSRTRERMKATPPLLVILMWAHYFARM